MPPGQESAVVPVNARTQGALRAVAVLAGKFSQPGPCTANIISGEAGVSRQFLGQILQQLRSAGIVESVMGREGGFRLARNPAQITVHEVIQATDPALYPLNGSEKHHLQPHSPTDVIETVVHEADAKSAQFLVSITLEDVLHRARSSSSDMYHI